MFVSRGRCGTWRHPPLFRVAGVALGHIHRRFVWQMWHLWHWAGSGGALGRAGARLVAGDAAQLCVAGVSLGDIHLRFAWQVCGTWSHSLSFRVAGVALMALGFVLRGRRGTYGTGLALVARWGTLGRQWRRPTLRGSRGTWRHPSSFRVAVALVYIHLRSAWQAWHLVTSTLALGDIHLKVSRGRCGTWRHPPSFRVAGVWHLVTFTFVSRGKGGTDGTGLALGARWGTLGRQWRRPTLRGRRGTWRHPASFRVAVALVYIHLRSAWLGHFHVSTWRHPPSFRVAGLELGHIHLIIVLRGRRVIYGTGLALVARLGALGRACSPVTRPNFAWQGWQAWHLATSIFVSRGRCCRCWFQ